MSVVLRTASSSANTSGSIGDVFSTVAKFAFLRRQSNRFRLLGRHGDLVRKMPNTILD